VVYFIQIYCHLCSYS